MAWVTAIRKFRLASLRKAWNWLEDFWLGVSPRASSRLAQLILVANFVALGVLIFGMLALSETRRGLVNAKLDNLLTQGTMIANVLERGASEDFPAPAPALRNGDARALLRQVYQSDENRVLVFDKGGHLVADSFLLDDVVEFDALPPPATDERGILGFIADLPGDAGQAISNLFGGEEAGISDIASLETEVDQAIAGERVSGVRRDENGRRIVSVSVPIQPVRAVIGVVTVESYDLDALIAAERRALLPFTLIACLVSIMSSLALTVFIARPIRRLAKAAREARRAGGRRVKMPDMRHRKDEIGVLATELYDMTETLYDRLDAIERFAADVAHELKNPLTSIRSAAEVLPKAKDDERRDRLLRVIHNDVGRLDRLISDISRASRVDAELAREDIELMDVGGLLSELAETYNAASDGQGAQIAYQTHVRRSVIKGREGPLGQVFRNLIDNAMTFSPDDGTINIDIHRDHLGDDPALLVTVDDDGPGIPEDNLETIFERFYTQRPQGAAFGTHSGLGLAISRQIVEAHGGRISATNRLGAQGQILGARFSICLPRVI